MFCSFLLTAFLGVAQETANGSDVNSFIIGGGQEFTESSVFVNSVAILDVYTIGGGGGGGGTVFEAGMPFSAGAGAMPEVWLNYTYRPIDPNDESEIFVRSSHPIPAGIDIEARVIEVSSGGDFVDRGENGNFSIDENNGKIVKSFGAGYTDDGETNGYKIEYTFSNSGTESLPAGFSIIYEIIKK